MRVLIACKCYAVGRVDPQELHLRPSGEGEAGAGKHDVCRSLSDVFGHHVEGVVHDVGVVAGAAGHGVGAGSAVQRVVTCSADQDIVRRITRDVVVARAAGHVLDRG